MQSWLKHRWRRTVLFSVRMPVSRQHKYVVLLEVPDSGLESYDILEKPDCFLRNLSHRDLAKRQGNLFPGRPREFVLNVLDLRPQTESFQTVTRTRHIAPRRLELQGAQTGPAPKAAYRPSTLRWATQLHPCVPRIPKS